MRRFLQKYAIIIMVKFHYEFPLSSEYNPYKSYYQYFPDLELSDFQKFAIIGIVTGNHTLSCVPTGSGKTLPAIFAINHFTRSTPRKKVIYTSPIKALSNQKYYEFVKKFPHLSIGLITGDIKTNPNADVLIMTAEILQNTLLKKKDGPSSATDSSLSFDMDLENELGCIIHDEVHMINDKNRGHVWESMIMLTPPNAQLVMLSATLDNPIAFANWIERTTFNEKRERFVFLGESNYRPVPLSHYTFVTATAALFKKVKDKPTQQTLKKQMNSLRLVQSPTNQFFENIVHENNRFTELQALKEVKPKRSFVLNEVCKLLVEQKKLPAVCFILSKAAIANAAKEVVVPLLEDDSKVGYTIANRCETLLRSKVLNHQEYLQLPEYNEMIAFLEKGIAVHHSGILPIIREIVELMFEEGHVKLLFATETFSVGLNMPIKTAIFTSFQKFDGSGVRLLNPQEYIQAAGRAGRRGIDEVGTVIHLVNLMPKLTPTQYKSVLLPGAKQPMKSNFQISFHLAFHLALQGRITVKDPACHDWTSESTGNGQLTVDSFCDKSLLKIQNDSVASGIDQEITKLNGRLDILELSQMTKKTSDEVLDKYIELKDIVENRKCSKTKLKEYTGTLRMMEDNNRHLEKDMMTKTTIANTVADIKKLEESRTTVLNQISTDATMVAEYLLSTKFMQATVYKNNMIAHYDGETKTETETPLPNTLELTEMGKYAMNIREMPCLVISEMLITSFDYETPGKEIFNTITAEELVCLLAMFSGIRYRDEFNTHPDMSINDQISVHQPLVSKIIEDFNNEILYHEDFEGNVNTGTDYSMSPNMVLYMSDWCKASTPAECNDIIQRVQADSNNAIQVGDLVKAIMKINNAANEIAGVAEQLGHMHLLGKTKEVPGLTLKYIVTNESLYV